MNQLLIHYWYVPLILLAGCIIGGIVLAIFEAKKTARSRKVQSAEEASTGPELHTNDSAVTPVYPVESVPDATIDETAEIPDEQVTTTEEMNKADEALQTSQRELSMATITLKLGRSRSLQSEFERILTEIDNQKQNLIIQFLPGFYRTANGIQLIYLPVTRYEILERALLFWKDSYRSEKIATLLVLYLFAREFAFAEKSQADQELPIFSAENFLYSVMAYAKLNSEDRSFLQSVYIDQEPDIDLLPKSVRNSENQFTLCAKILSPNAKFTRHSMLALEKKFQTYFPDLGFVKLYGRQFYQHGNTLLRARLAKRWPEAATRFIPLLFRQFLRYGKINRLHQVLKNSDFKNLIENSNDDAARFPEAAYPVLADYIYRKEFASDTLSDFVPNALPPVNKNTIREMPIAYRKAAYKVLCLAERWSEALEVFRNLPFNEQKNQHNRFYRARALFKLELFQEAWNEIYKVWSEDNENLVYLNEAAIYATYAGKEEIAEEIFVKLKELYPDHAQTLYNEALFFEKKAKSEIKKRWQDYQRVSQETSSLPEQLPVKE